MNWKPVIYSSHARGERTGRRISRNDVRGIIVAGTPEPIGEPYTAKIGTIGDGRRVRIIYVERASDILVVTVMVDQTKAGVAREKAARKRRKE